MRNERDIEVLKAELADKKAILADLESRKIWLPLETKIALRRRIAELEISIENIDSRRS